MERSSLTIDQNKRSQYCRCGCRLAMMTRSFPWIFASLLFVRIIGTVFNTVHDCDEVYNYWEPLHRLLYGFGKQPWEYSPQYALRSYLYILVYYLIAQPCAWMFGNGALKYAVFYSVRCIMALDFAWLEARLIRSASDLFPGVTWVFFTALLCNAGMSMAATTFLPSTFAMRCMTAATVAVLQHDIRGVIWWSVVGVVLGWPVAGVAFLPYALHVLIQPHLSKSFLLLFVSMAAVFIPLALCDCFFYGRPTVSLLNFVRYNVIGGQSTLYGVESSSFYFRNGLLNFNFLLALSAILPLVSGITYIIRQQEKRKSGIRDGLSPANLRTIMLACLPVYTWAAAITLLPHKEERFLYVVYPQICLSGSVVLVLIGQKLLRPLLPDPFGRSIEQSVKTGIMIAYVCLSVMRIAAVWVNLRAPMTIYRSLPVMESSDRVYVCTGDEWHRYPSSFFLPHPSMRLGFLKQEFDEVSVLGLLPGDFSEKPMGTRHVHDHFNDKNIMEPANYVHINACAFVVDYESFGGSSLAQLYDPKGQWKHLQSLEILDRRHSPGLTRMFYIPYLNSRLNVFGHYMLYRTRHSE